MITGSEWKAGLALYWDNNYHLHRSFASDSAAAAATHDVFFFLKAWGLYAVYKHASPEGWYRVNKYASMVRKVKVDRVRPLQHIHLHKYAHTSLTE